MYKNKQQITYQIRDRVTRQLRYHIKGCQIWKHIRDIIWDQTYNQVVIQVRAQIYDQAREQVRGQIKE